MLRNKFYILLNILFVIAFVAVTNGQSKTRIGQAETVNFPTNGEVKIEVVEKIGKPMIISFSKNKKRLGHFTLKNSGSYIPFDFNAATNPITRFRVLENIEGLPSPLIQAVAVNPGGSDHSFWTILFAEIDGKIKMLTPLTTENSIQGGVHIGILGTGNGNGLAVYNFVWDDTEAHYDSHKYRVDLYKYDEAKGQFVNSKTFTSKEKHAKKTDALKELGFGAFGNRLNDFDAIKDFREDDNEYVETDEIETDKAVGLAKIYEEFGKTPQLDYTDEFKEKAISLLSDCIEKSNSEAMKSECLIHRGYLQADEKLAMVDFYDALKIDSKNPKTFYFRGKWYILQNDENNALRDFDTAIELGTKEAEVYFYRGQMFADQEENQKAINDFTQALKLNPEMTMALNLRANAYADAGDFDNAIKDATKYIELEKDGEDGETFRFVRATFYQRKGDKKKAAEEFNSILKMNPDDEAAKEALGDLFLMKDMVISKGEAILENENADSALEFLKGFPEFADQPEINNLKAVIYLNVGDTEKADAAFTEQSNYYLNQGIEAHQEINAKLDAIKKGEIDKNGVSKLLELAEPAKSFFYESLYFEQIRIDEYKKLGIEIDKKNSLIKDTAAKDNLLMLTFFEMMMNTDKEKEKQISEEMTKIEKDLTNLVIAKKMEIEKKKEEENRKNNPYGKSEIPKPLPQELKKKQ